MKKSLILFCSLLSLTALGQRSGETQTAFNQPKSFGGFVSASVKAGKVQGMTAVSGGGALALSMGQKMNIGFAARAAATMEPFLANDGRKAYYFGYGGLYLEPMLRGNKLTHFTFPFVLGIGGGQMQEQHYNETWHEYDWETNPMVFFVAEPGINLEFNVARVMRLGMGASYRFVSDVDVAEAESIDLSGFNFGMTLKLGWM